MVPSVYPPNTHPKSEPPRECRRLLTSYCIWWKAFFLFFCPSFTLFYRFLLNTVNAYRSAQSISSFCFKKKWKKRNIFWSVAAEFLEKKNEATACCGPCGKDITLLSVFIVQPTLRSRMKRRGGSKNSWVSSIAVGSNMASSLKILIVNVVPPPIKLQNKSLIGWKLKEKSMLYSAGEEKKWEWQTFTVVSWWVCSLTRAKICLNCSSASFPPSWPRVAIWMMIFSTMRAFSGFARAIVLTEKRKRPRLNAARRCFSARFVPNQSINQSINQATNQSNDAPMKQSEIKSHTWFENIKLFNLVDLYMFCENSSIENSSENPLTASSCGLVQDLSENGVFHFSFVFLPFLRALLILPRLWCSSLQWKLH